MRRVLKLQSKQCHLFAHDKKREQHLKELKEIRDICKADFKNITDSIKEFPSANTLLMQKAPSTRAITAEENLMATTSLMYGEVTERFRALLAGMIAECHEIQGPPPCNFAIVGNYRFGTRDLSPFDPITIFIVIEKEGAGIRNYFRNTLALLGMKIQNLGETSLPSLNIRSLQWFAAQAKPSGFSLANYIDDTEKKDFSTIPLDCLRTPKELLKLAVSEKQDIRLALTSMLHGATFITGWYCLSNCSFVGECGDNSMIEIVAKNFIVSKASLFLFTKFAISFNTSSDLFQSCKLFCGAVTMLHYQTKSHCCFLLQVT